MFAGNSKKILTAAIALAIFFPACRFRQTQETAAPTQTPSAAEIIRELPFSTKEQENYQAEIVTRIYANGEKTEFKTFTARSGMRRLMIFNVGEKTEVAALKTADNSFISISQPKKIYTENKLTINSFVNSDDDFLTTERLNAENTAAFEKMGTENNLTKFRVRLNDSENSEIIIYYDDNLKIPVKQEFYKIDGGQKTLTFSVEVNNFRTETDEKFFAPPPDLRQVSVKEFQEIMWREKLKTND
ncbi:MAG: hypothetical protein ACR2LT_06465 [Pyrinomonadaceae bacterium]